jgi:hypothetical protein
MAFIRRLARRERCWMGWLRRSIYNWLMAGDMRIRHEILAALDR